MHEKGDCSSGDGMSAGGHFNPLGKGHGHHERRPASMRATCPTCAPTPTGSPPSRSRRTGITIGSGATDIVGKGLIVHRDPDDYKSQPVGNAGPRLACAVIAKG